MPRRDGGRRPISSLVLSSVFPSSTRPTFGVFVRERVRHVAESCRTVVVAPVPWVPFNGAIRGREVARTPLFEDQAGLPVYHPRFLCPPAVGKSADAALYAASLLPFVARLKRQVGFDVIDAHFAYPDGVAGVLLGRVLRRPAVITLRGSHDLRHAGYRLRRPQIAWALRSAARVIAVSDSLRQAVAELGLPSGRISVIPNGVDPQRFAPREREAARRELGLPLDRRILVTVASLTEGKGQHRVVELLPRLLEACPDILYVAVGADPGGGRYAHTLRELISRQDVNGRVRLVGARPHDEIPTWLAAADIFCLATRIEGWCNAVTEALACGLPVVTTRVGGNIELVRAGRDGSLVPFWDAEAFRLAVLDGLQRRWDRAEIAARARLNSWQRTAVGIVREFEACLGERARCRFSDRDEELAS